MGALLWITVAAPLVGAAATRAGGRRAAPLAVGAAALAAIPAALLLAGAARGERAAIGGRWLAADGLDVGLRLDPLAAAMSATVAGIGLAALLFSAGYFADDERRASALAGLLSFLGAMQGLVLADGFLALLIFWELVGAASARLIAYTREDPRAPGGAVRAFLTTRTADLGFYVALLALFAASGSLAFGQARPAGALGALVGLGLVLAAVGKSAQAPLHTWLAGAMAGPTPVSALLHSATMVAAGVYLLVRAGDLLAGWPLALAGWIGAITALAGAAIALAQDDLKRVLAGSTASQLGLMFVGAAAGGPAVAVFHLIAHGAGKAGLFLAAGAFQHARGSVALEDLRGAGRDDPRVFAGFAVCGLSIAAIPPLAGFWSKEHVTAAAELRPVWFALVLLSAAGAVAYLLRPALVLLDRGGAGRPALRAGRGPMLAGLGVLAVAVVPLGALGGPVERLLEAGPLPSSTASLLGSLAALAAGALVVLRPVGVPGALRRAAERQLYAAALQSWLAERPARALARALSFVEERVVDRAVDGTGRGGLRAAAASEAAERRGIDAAVDGLAALVGRSGARSRALQSGRLHEYLRDAVLGAAALVVLVALTSIT